MRLGIGVGLSHPAGAASAVAFAQGKVAPDGYHWEFVTDRTTGERVVDRTNKNQPVVALVRN